MKKLSALIFGLLLSQAALAGNETASGLKITKIHTWDDHAAIYFTPSYTNQQGCVSPTETRFILDMSNDINKEMYSSILAAAMADKEVGFGIGGCYSGGQPSPLIYRVDVEF